MDLRVCCSGVGGAVGDLGGLRGFAVSGDRMS